MPYSEGDNDWTDCDRESMTVRFDELERLTFIRYLFFRGPDLETTRDIPDVIRQAGLPENPQWRMGNLVMGT